MRLPSLPLRPARLVAPLLSSLLLALAAVLPTEGAAQRRWKEIGRTSVGNPVYIDPRSVRRADGIITATVRATFVKPVKTAKGNLTASRTVVMFDCARRLVAVKENTLYLDERANRVFEHRVVGRPGYSTTIKGSLPDVALAHFCPAPAAPARAKGTAP